MNTLPRDQMLRHNPCTDAYQFSTHQATAQVLRDAFKRIPSCKCFNGESQAWGHAEVCRRRVQRCADVEQSLHECESLRVTWEFAPDGTVYGFDVQGFYCEKFAPGNAGWRVITSL